MQKHNVQDFMLPQEKLNGIYRGVIEDNNDPEYRGRCRIRIFGIHSPSKIKTTTDGIPTSDLPWAEPALSLLEGSISGFGLFCVPLQGSHVFVFFESGNILQPRYFASVPGVPKSSADTTKGFYDPTGEYPHSTKLFQPDFNRGRGTYPHNIVLETHGGHIIEIDSTPTNKRIKVKHASGTVVEVDHTGNLSVSIVQSETKTIAQNKTLVVSGTDDEFYTGERTVQMLAGYNETTQGDKSEIVIANKDETVGGDKDETIAGELTVNIGGNCTVVCGGIVDIQAAEVNIGSGPKQSVLNAAAAAVFNNHEHEGTTGPTVTMGESEMSTVTKVS